jgi:hypothetical protein
VSSRNRNLLAKAAVMAEPCRHGPVGRLRQHCLYDKSHGDTAAIVQNGVVTVDAIEAL